MDIEIVDQALKKEREELTRRILSVTESVKTHRSFIEDYRKNIRQHSDLVEQHLKELNEMEGRLKRVDTALLELHEGR